MDAPGGSVLQANFPVLAGMLVAVIGSFPEAVEVAFLGLPFAINRNQADFETFDAKPVRIELVLRLDVAPCHSASDTLILHHLPPVKQVMSRAPPGPSRENPPAVTSGAIAPVAKSSCPHDSETVR
jgi:hypothetical protein